MTHPTRAFSGSIINRLTGSKILARVGQISVAFPGDVEQDNSISISGLPNQIDNKQSKVHEDCEDSRSQGFRPKWRH